jgi:PAS domain S-box-containing protein
MQHVTDVSAMATPSIERKTAREQQLFLLKYLHQGVLLTCFVMAMVVFLLWNEVDRGRLLAWYGIVVTISLLRLVLLRRRPHLLASDGPDEVVHLGLHTGVFASALVCSVAVFLAGQSPQPADLMIVIALLGGMAAGALGTLGAIISVYNLYLLTLLTPPVYWLLQRGDDTGNTTALLALVFLGSMLLTGRGYGSRLAQSYRLQFRNMALNEHLNRASAEALDNSRKLQLEVEQRRGAELKIKAAAQRLQQANKHLQTQIRERQRSEEAVRRQAIQIARSETRLRAVIGNSFDGILTTAAGGKIQSANPAAQRLLGATQDQLSGRSLEAFLPGLSFESGSPARQELWVNQGEERKIPVSFAAAPLAVTGEQGYVCVLRDETEAEAARQALLSAKDAAESANRAKSEFLSSMSHELRTPLNAILGFAQLLEADPANPLSEAQKANTNEINKAGWHLLSLINDVLDLAQIEAGRLEIRPEEVVVGDLVADAATLLAPLASDYQVTLIDEVAAPGPKVYADPMRLKQVVINLLSNAIKYNRPGGRVVIQTPNCTRGLCRLMVKDTGIGLTPEQQPRVFERFSRVADRKADIEGSGIGLAVTKKLVQGMGGEIGVLSQPGVGSSFWVDLPGVVDDKPVRQVAISS